MAAPPWRRLILGIAIGYPSWLGMMAVHELGHVMHAWVTGGRIVSVSVPLAGFSQTIVHPNPREHLVVWGGPIWGVTIPLIGCGLFRVVRGRVPDVWRFFTGLCLVANGAYVGLGGFIGGSGDAHDLLRLGTPRAVTIAFGFVCTALGLWCWHRTPGFSFKPPGNRDDVEEPRCD
jgi:hypothetical protein